MPTITEGQLRFEFPDGWQASKFDEWSFYRNQFNRLASAEIVCSNCERELICSVCGAKRVAGTKGVDILALQTTQTCWQIEIKDYRTTRVGTFESLADEVALKVRDTMSALVAARLNAHDADEKRTAASALRCRSLRVVLHLEQPVLRSRLQSKATRRANVLQRLKQLIKAIDAHPIVVDLDSSANVDWNVTQIGAPPI